MRGIARINELHEEIEDLEKRHLESKHKLQFPVKLYYSLYSKINDVLTTAKNSHNTQHISKIKIIIQSLKDIIYIFEKKVKEYEEFD